MALNLYFSKNVFQRLRVMKTSFKGCLYGVRTHECLLVLGFTVSQTLDDGTFAKVDDGFNVIRDNLPAGVDFLGYVTVTSDELPTAGKTKEGNTDSIVLICNIQEEFKVTVVRMGKGGFKEIPYETLEHTEVLEKLYLVRIQYRTNVLVEATAQAVKDCFARLTADFASGKLCFHVKEAEVFIGRDKKGRKSTFADILSHESQGGKGKGKKELSDFRTVNVRTLMAKTEEMSISVKKSSFRIAFSDTEKLSIPVMLEGVALAAPGQATSSLYELFVESLLRNLALVEDAIVRGLDQKLDFLSLRPYNARMLNFPHTFLCVWPQKVDEGNALLKDRRRIFHKVLGLPVTRPFFRRSNAVPQADGGVLLNTHVGLKAAQPGWQQHLVQGSYGYYHYMQQNYNDSGWGCAYRSLQTIFSWFKYQGYTEQPIPSHYDIQEALVSVGDKPRAFLGSSQWIGSTEVSLCLEKFLNISSRIMYVQSGKDLADKGAELAMHFESQGSPIMIGGGVLAHTIIGVDNNRETGETKFLILDPHYTGAEDLQVIQQKGFCNWKTGNFWDKKTFYNLCMPIRPIEF
ncbi:ufm1-specific protease 2 [Phlebotomus argentipes]|uniref:ufm1-specific protease 2 n=1 Tax=Phlebotomus argentipes TaxID=94469 RepID=UPI0028933BEB|nr:ufm1-specific protease 2 [Phlebotomus argentipes]